jgi:hypothetical protein
MCYIANYLITDWRLIMAADEFEIENILQQNNRAVEKAIIALNSKKLGYEFSSARQSVSGYSDARRGAYYANWIGEGKPLSGVHLNMARKLALAYTDELTKIANKVRAPLPLKEVIKAVEGSTLTLQRRGMFSIETYGDSHCGVGELVDVSYEVKVKCVCSLDHRGFLFDQLEVDKFFQSIQRTALSCEELAIKSGAGLVDMIKSENPGIDVFALDLVLSPKPFAASMTYAWSR